ncbi:hypothetical protein R4670_16495 [Acinetobacter baumannii]|nr:hypothetical protein [Acinetobacter baumannii]
MRICYLDNEKITYLRRHWTEKFVASIEPADWKEEYDVILQKKEDLLDRIETKGFFGDPDNRLNDITYVAILDSECDDLDQVTAIAQVIATRRGREHNVRIMSLVFAPYVEITEKAIYDAHYADAFAYIITYYIAKCDVKGSITKVYAEDEVAQVFLKDMHDQLADELRKHSLKVAMQGLNWLSFTLLKTN